MERRGWRGKEVVGDPRWSGGNGIEEQGFPGFSEGVGALARGW